MYFFNNGEMIFSRIFLDVLYKVYFNFETTTGDTVFFDSSYCQICSFPPNLNFEKIIIFRSFQQNGEWIYDLSHFKQEHVAYFDAKTVHQLKGIASAVLACEKSTFLTELFSVELKFTIDTLNNWFSNKIKPIKFLDLNNIQKQILRKSNCAFWNTMFYLWVPAWCRSRT